MQLSIVEDSAELVELLAKGLRAAGYEADIFSSLNEATTFYSACIPDLGLQDGDAFMILQEIKQRDDRIPALLLTAAV
jgi:DNA-binding response OmpR family regulator